MDEIRFADGFDTPERVLFGLGPWQLVVLLAGLVVGYIALRSPLPQPASAPFAAFVAAIAAGLAWIRVSGRPALDWAMFACRYAASPRAGRMAFEATAALAAPAPAAPPQLPPSPQAPPRPEPQPPARIIPLRPDVLRDAGGPAAVAAPLHLPAPPRSRRLSAAGAHRIVFFSQRGGTGRTSLAVEIACLLAAGAGTPATPPRRTALVDFDVDSPAVAERLGLTGRTLLDYALAHPDERRLSDFLTTHDSGAAVLLGPTRNTAGEWPLTAGLVREVLRELDLEGFDVVVSDVPAQLTPMSKSVLLAADDVFIVLAPTPSGIRDAYRTTELLRSLGLRQQLRFVLNRVRGHVDVAEMSSDLGTHVVAEIPEDHDVLEAERARTSVAALGCEAGIALQRFAGRLQRELLVPCPR